MMIVEWTKYAENQRDKIANYISRTFSENHMQTFIRKVWQSAKLLKYNPYMGSIDPLFADRPITYRSLVVANKNKLVYHIVGEIIYIDAFWDCRQDPMAQAKKVK